MGQRGFVRAAIPAVIAVCVVLSATDAALAAHRARAQAVPQSPEALYLRCRTVIFRKSGRALR
jgi:hypothetical protein